MSRLFTVMCRTLICSSVSASTVASIPCASGVEVAQPFVGQTMRAGGGFGASATTGALWAQLKSETHDRMAMTVAPARVNVARREAARPILSLRLRLDGGAQLQ